MSKFKDNLPLILASVSATLLAAGLFLFGGGQNHAAFRSSDATSPAQAAQTEKNEGSSAPDFDVTDLSGERLKLSDLKGKVVILDFWSINCGPCIEANRKLNELYKDYGKMGFVVVGFSLDADAQSVKTFLQTMPVSYPIAMAPAQLVKDFGGVFSIPQTYVIDKQGKIVKKYEGYSDLSAYQMEKLVKKLLTGA